MPTPNLSRRASKTIKEMQHKHAKQVLIKIIELCGDPTPPDSEHLRNNKEGYRRADIGEYRIIYRVDGDTLEIHTIGKRNDDEAYHLFDRR